MILDTMIRGARASITLDNINLSNGYDTSRTGVGGGHIELTGARSATYEQLYKTQPWIYTSVNRISRGIGRLPLHPYKDVGARQGERERQRTGPLAELLDYPYTSGNPSLWKQAILTNLLIHSNVILPKIRRDVGMPPYALPPSSFAYWRPVYGPRSGQLEWWLFDGGTPETRIPYRPEEVVHVHPWATGRGVVALAPLEALRNTLANEDAAQRAALSSFEHGFRPPGAYSVEGRIHPDDMKKLRADLDETYGGPDNIGKILLLDNGAKYQQMADGSLVDADLRNLRTLNREEVLAVYNLPQPSAGVLDRATFSNVVEQHLMEYQDTYGPWTTLIEETLQTQLIDDEPTMRGQYVEFNYKEVLKGDPIKEMEAGFKAVGGPWMTPDEFRATQNMSPLPNGEGSKLNPAPNTAGTPSQSN